MFSGLKLFIYALTRTRGESEGNGSNSLKTMLVGFFPFIIISGDSSGVSGEKGFADDDNEADGGGIDTI